MKSLKLFLFTLIISVFWSCGEDAFSERILGTWVLQSSEIFNCIRDENLSPLTTVDGNNCVPLATLTDVLCNLTITFTTEEAIIESGDDVSSLESAMASYTLNESNETGLLQFSEPLAFSLEDDNLVLNIPDNGCDQQFVLVRR